MESINLPCPGFEGFEKRLDIEFESVQLPNHSDTPKYGLRSIPRNELDSILSSAQCTIVSQLRNTFFDSYVLSESSLFVYPNRVVIKTCGTTKLLECISLLLESAFKISMQPRRCRYSRGTFMFPQAQPKVHQSFSDEAKYLDKFFGHLGSGGKAFVMGDALSFPNWHIYVADSLPLSISSKKSNSVYTLEMCMTKLDKHKASQFFQNSGIGGVRQVTNSSGIADLLPGSEIDDFLFDPCGYSMNGIEGNSHSTIHITPEDGFSYASFETMGYSDSDLNFSALVKKVLYVFKPDCFSIALHVDGAVDERGSWGGSLPNISNYFCDGTSRQVLPMDSSVVFHTFKKIESITNVVHRVDPIPLIEDVACVFDGLKESFKALSSKAPKIISLFPDSLKFGENVASIISAINPSIIGSSEKDTDSFIHEVISASKLEDPFYVMDLNSVLHLWSTWTNAMPRVKPFYAVKCNPDIALLSLLASLGTGFDVASQSELYAVTSLGVSSPNVIFANPCKLPSHMSAASKQGVNLTTFDSEMELVKFKKFYPNVQAILRLRADDRAARCPLGVKYGAEYEDCEDLLMCAKRLGINVVGIAFHVGSGASDPASYADGIYSARTLFDTAVRLGMPDMWFLDIGGGFTSKGGNGVSFSAAASVINDSLDKYFPSSMGVTVIGEPGRFFAEAPFTLATHVFGSRVRRRASETKPEYWINDGLYGSMNCLLYDHAELSVRPLKMVNYSPEPQQFSNELSHSQYQSTVFGPTCDGLDTVLRDVWLPKLDCGDWLIFPRMGAYTKAAGSSFNGFETSKIRTVYVYSMQFESDDHGFHQKQHGELSEGSYDEYSSDSGDEVAFHSSSNMHFSNIFCAQGKGMSSSSSDEDGF